MKIVRKFMKIFGTDAGANQRGKFGSLANGSAEYTTDPEEIQELANYDEGWFSAVLGNNSPCIEDMNALQYLFAYQIAYVLQQGIPEWDDDTEYFQNQFVSSGGKVYISLTDNNEGNAVSDETNWASFGQNLITTERIYANQTWSAPNRVNKIKIRAFRPKNKSIANSSLASCFLDPSGKAYSIGSDDFGALGDGGTTGDKVSSPVAVQGNREYASIHGGEDFFIALEKNGKIWGWGNGNAGQFADGGAGITVSQPILVGEGFKKVATGAQAEHVLGLRSDGKVYSWGTNISGQLGNDTTSAEQSTMQEVVGLGSIDIIDIAVKGNSSYLLSKEGSVYSFGDNTFGALGDGTSVAKSSPVAVVGSHVFKEFFAGGGIKEDGSVWVWGNYSGAASFGNSPVQITSSIKFIRGVGSSNALNLISDEGDLYTLGEDHANADGNFVATSSPTLVIGGKKFIDTSGYQFHVTDGGNTYAITNEGQVYSWGANSFYSLGINPADNTPKSSPVIVGLGSKNYGLLLQDGSIELDVVPGQDYDINFNYHTTFGGIPIGTLIDYIEIEYID